MEWLLLALLAPLVLVPAVLMLGFARSLGVRCWPTTVRLARDGTFCEATFGLVPDLETGSKKSSSAVSA
ncbi:MAG TPA: hypothetical protein VLE43_08510 [Candidatus Saccharimonadia bacterium]|nr:hypothetical protein [Candidatus Saccharimonadia bacterium]